MPMSVYRSEKDGAWESIERRFEGMPLIVFSKTYCPYSRRAKALLASYNLSPAATIVEVDLRDDGDLIKHILTRLTGRGTFPNAILNGVSIGGSDDLHSLHAQGRLQEIIENAGIHTDGG
ncbi:thioredoxin-like protein [Coniophora puteana RWD-64-598 SS2]|uniref:Thioredoxin-like protein n=1 Tax=Coniophora puteana (strain RWD-64-598) TaxID=741705 RepID=A0A5M3MVL2_CONPW|nr:thioredoxin-like protein [Coniophora puteana RWD-64-598 SS2]EIW83202.1 thioredoxin-like protein [Coniophora puteana RWD-64-598 SS2]